MSKEEEKKEQQPLDDLLSSALDELDDEDSGAQTHGGECAAQVEDEGGFTAVARKAATTSAESSASAAEEQAGKNFEADAADLLKQISDPEFAKTLEDTMKMLEGTGQSGGENALEEEELKKMLANLGLAGAEGGDGAANVDAEKLSEEVMKSMMSEFQKMGENNSDEFENMMKGMMAQLISKDVMYPPLQAICQKYPEWLADNEHKLEKEEYERYGKQYEMYQRICTVYETEPENTDKLTELLEEMQQTGQPPVEIMKELAPEMKLDENGMPDLSELSGQLPPGLNPNSCPQQ